MTRIILAICLSLQIGLLNVASAQDTKQKAVLITGASTGIGRNMAETLAKEGYFVYAGARKQADIDELSAIDNIMGLRLDVTVQEDIDAAVEQVRGEGRGLYGLVNNAGVVVVAPLIEIDEEDMQFQMDVNVFGPIRVTRAFAPLIIQSKGRITTTGSISGVLAGPLTGPYAMTKHAIEAFGDSLALEMAKFDVKVSIIEPGSYGTSVMQNLQRRMERRRQSPEGSLYEEEIAGMIAGLENYDQGPPPDAVSTALLEFLSAENPKPRYMVVPVEAQAAATIRQLLTELKQFNEGQRFAYDRDDIVAMLDEVLGAAN